MRKKHQMLNLLGFQRSTPIRAYETMHNLRKRAHWLRTLLVFPNGLGQQIQISAFGSSVVFLLKYDFYFDNALKPFGSMIDWRHERLYAL
jgi:hypothetical protein